jgi:hypothetical protein
MSPYRENALVAIKPVKRCHCNNNTGVVCGWHYVVSFRATGLIYALLAWFEVFLIASLLIDDPMLSIICGISVLLLGFFPFSILLMNTINSALIARKDSFYWDET